MQGKETVLSSRGVRENLRRSGTCAEPWSMAKISLEEVQVPPMTKGRGQLAHKIMDPGVCSLE